MLSPASKLFCGTKEIEIVHRLFLIIAMYCQASSSQFNESLNLPHAVGSNSLKTTYILFKLPYVEQSLHQVNLEGI